MKPRVHKIAPAQCDLLVNAASRGDLTATTAVLNADPWVYLKRDQLKALLTACVTAPNAVALLDHFHARSLFRGTTFKLADITFLHACRHGADAATVHRLVELLFGTLRPDVEKGLNWAMKTRNGPLVEHLVTSYTPDDCRDYGAILCAAIKMNDPAFVLRFIGLPPVQVYLASLESAFEPRCIRMVAAHQKPHEWLAKAMGRSNMDAVVEVAAARCPLVTADVALWHCALTPKDAAKYEHLYTRRNLLNHQIEAFHQAIQAGHVDVVRSMLKEVPALRRSRMDNDVSALMASSLAPNSLALLQSLHFNDATTEAVRCALLHACRHGADAASTEFLWKWVESLNLTEYNRDAILREGIDRATSHEHLASVNALLACVRKWTAEKAPDFMKAAMAATSTDQFARALLDLPVLEGLYKALDDKMARTSPTSDTSDCDCVYECECAGMAHSTVSDWVSRALHYGMRQVACWLEARWPAITRKDAFVLCNGKLANDAAQWAELNQRYARDVTWRHTRAAYLVQRCFLPGSNHLGRHIATYLYAFDAQVEYKALTHRDPEPAYRHANMYYDSNEECYYYSASP